MREDLVISTVPKQQSGRTYLLLKASERSRHRRNVLSYELHLLGKKKAGRGTLGSRWPLASLSNQEVERTQNGPVFTNVGPVLGKSGFRKVPDGAYPDAY